MQKNAITVQKLLDKKLTQLVQQHYKKYLKPDNDKISEKNKEDADIKVPLTNQIIIDEHDYIQLLKEEDFQQHPKYFTEIKRYKINELKLLQKLKDSDVLNSEGERRLEELTKFKIKDDMNLTSKSSWQKFVRNKDSNTKLKRSNSCYF